METATWHFEPIAGAPLGAVAHGVDLPDVDDAFFEELPRQLARHGVIVFRDQHLTPEALQEVATRLGPLEPLVLDQFCMPGHPFIYILSNIVENGRPIGSSTDGYGWHTDQAYYAQPTAYTLLYGVEVPPEGADTQFANTRLAYETLPPERQSALRKLWTEHSYMKMIMDRAKNPAFAGKVPLPTPEQQAKVPDVVQPLVRRHPVDASLSLYPGGQTVKRVVGIEDAAAGVALVQELLDWCTNERFQYRHVWSAHDLVIWDNRCTVHRATPYDKERYRRLMWRVSVKGERPLSS
ncbi:TauD/TfdA family dioxygenase [Pigmentiphaga sp.]|uniref:TauD/TfdA dioxygenase family protein n=1 Tax=Pigmentiphaga sp. TaxID=1977564 RepID=UPI0025F365A3|nr:TauD/TfdA family dioxygenase [Pigmentiphaga sp.]MBX6318842.1 TauD/TfdA family dioxygenase [Pigmentiphaga sp.]